MKKIPMFLIAVFVFCLWTGMAMAQEPTLFEGLEIPEGSPPPLEDNIIAEVGIDDPQIIEQNDRKMKIAFSIINYGKEVQPQIKYSVTLEEILESEDEEMTLSYPVDEFVFDETLSLSTGQEIFREVEYEVPEVFGGEFVVMVNAQNENGLLFSLVPAGTIRLEAKEGTVWINETSCNLYIEGDEDPYFLNQGVDIDNTEVITVRCDVENNFNEQKSLRPVFDTHRRTSAGEKVASSEGVAFNLAASGSDEVDFILPLESESQAYDVVIRLKDEQGAYVSNQIKVRYVMRGESGTIQNARLDKDYYKKGEKAVLDLEFSGRVDFFPYSRFLGNDPVEASKKMSELVTDYQVDLKLEGREGVCYEKKDSPIEYGDFSPSIEMAIERDCLDPKLSVLIKNENGEILDSQTFEIESQVEEEESESGTDDKVASPLTNDPKKPSNANLIVLGISFLALIFLVLGVFISRRGRAGISMIFLLISGFLFWQFQIEDASAAPAGTVGVRTQNNWVYALCVTKSPYVYSDYEDCLRIKPLDWGQWGSCQSTYCKNNGWGAYVVANVNDNIYDPGQSSGNISGTLRNYSCSNGATTGRIYLRGAWRNSCTAAKVAGGIECVANASVPFSTTVGGAYNVNYGVQHTAGFQTNTDYKNLTYEVWEKPTANITLPHDKQTFTLGNNIAFRSSASLGYGGVSISKYVWTAVRPGTTSYNNPNICRVADGYDYDGDGNNDPLPGNWNDKDFDLNDPSRLGFGDHRICLAVEQTNKSGGDSPTYWDGDYVDITVLYPPKTNPDAVIDTPTTYTFLEGQPVNFSGHGNPGSGGGGIDAHGWVDIDMDNESSLSYQGTNCLFADGNRFSSSDSVNLSSLSLGTHKVCYNVMQRYFDGTTRWAGSNADHITINIVERPTAVIDTPTTYTFTKGDTIDFSGHGVLGSGDGEIISRGWVDIDMTNTSSGSYQGTNCAFADGNRFSSSDDVSLNSLSVGTHKICYNVLQRYPDGTTYWAGSNAAHIEIDIVNPTLTLSDVDLSENRCANGSSDRGIVDVGVLASYVGGTASGEIKYRFKCDPSLAFSGWQTGNTSTCEYDNAGTKTIEVEIEREGVVSSFSDTVDLSACSISGSLILTEKQCYDGSPSSAKVEAVASKTAGDAHGTLEYDFDCGSGYDGFDTGNIGNCSYDSSGTHSISAKIKQGDAETIETKSIVISDCSSKTVTANFNKIDGLCYTGDADSGSSSIEMEVTGGTASGFVDYYVDCGDGLGEKHVFSGDKTSYTYSCTYDSANIKSISARVEREGAQDSSGIITTTIGDCEPRLIRFESDTAIRKNEESATLTWEVVNANWCYGFTDVAGDKWLDKSAESSDGLHFDIVSPSVSTKYGLYCGNNYGGTRPEVETTHLFVDVEVFDMNLDVDSNSIDYDSSVTIDWSVDNVDADSCKRSWGPDISGSTNSATEVANNLKTNTTFTLECTKNGKTYTDTETVYVAACKPCTTVTTTDHCVWGTDPCTDCTYKEKCEAKTKKITSYVCNGCSVDPTCTTAAYSYCHGSTDDANTACSCTNDPDVINWHETSPR